MKIVVAVLYLVGGGILWSVGGWRLLAGVVVWGMAERLDEQMKGRK